MLIETSNNNPVRSKTQTGYTTAELAAVVAGMFIGTVLLIVGIIWTISLFFK
jgi:hypothetical protein